ncbi:DUF58 domain-containing protein [Thermolongibacillus altinsuensis]|uniref:DUF58 domain-containing protein n=1 Tax=Thermolongibacillus altinsuensis TaxID=575256 RepID=UPI00242A317F|nr:DUF58 domain-containing protein [Thermolongibacillus altinsuensis]GMB10166.1 hypothetical protein B1no1_28760 [Thermolongibacillus altinsuensis]
MRKNPIRQCVLIISLFVVLFVYAMFQGGFVSWFLFYSFLPLWLYSIVVFFYPLHALNVERTFNQASYHAGETVVVTVRMNMPTFFPVISFIVEEEWPQSLPSKDEKMVVFPFGRKTLTFTYEIRGIPRGEHIFSNIRIKITDFFGLVSKEAEFPLQHAMVVYPRYVEMNMLKVSQSFEQGSAVSPWQLHRDMTMAVGVREYVPGDRFSWIHWKASARKNDWMTKEFEEQQNEDVVLFLDRTPTPLFEEMVTFSASFVRANIKKGVQTGFVAIGTDRLVFHPQNSEAHLQRLFYALAKVKCDSAKSFEHIISNETMLWPASASFCYMTSYLSKDLAYAVGHMAMRGRNNVVFFMKNEGAPLSNEEQEVIEQLRKKRVTTVVVTPDYVINTSLKVGSE